MDRTWRPERAVDIADALDHLLDDMEARFVAEAIEPDPHLLPHASGLLALDQVCEGGLWPGTVTVLESPLPAVTRSMLYTCARRTEVATLLAVERVVDGTRWLLSGETGVAAELMRIGRLCEDDWRRVAEEIAGLAHRGLALTDAASLGGLSHVVDERRPGVLVVDDPDRLGPDEPAIERRLADLAMTYDTAVLTARPSRPEATDRTLDIVVRVTVVPHTLAGHAALVRVGGPSGLTAAQIDITTLTAVAS